MKPVEERKAQLQGRLAELEARLHKIDDELDQPVSERFEDMATEREDDEVLEDLGAAGLQEMRMVNAALDRIAEGVYGECTTCGDRISEERLDLLPHTPFCRNCAR